MLPEPVNLSRFDPQTLRLFLLAARSLNLTRAAQDAHMTLSALSKRISELEKQIGCELFIRRARGLELTPAGHALVEHAQLVIAAVTRLTSDMSAYSAGLRGQVRIWANTSSVIQFLPGDLAAFSRTHPAIRLSLDEKLSHEIITALTQERIDIGIFADNIPSGQVEKYFYRHDQLVVLVPRGHPLGKHKRIRFAQVLDNDFVGLSDGSSLQVRMQDAALAAGKTLRLRVQVSSFDAICRMIEAGLGVGLLPLEAVRSEIIGKGLHALALDDDWGQRTLYVGVRSAVGLKPDAQRLLDFLKQAHLAG
ncbi:LysR family transcriptional regulator [Advenella incenata]